MTAIIYSALITICLTLSACSGKVAPDMAGPEQSSKSGNAIQETAEIKAEPRWFICKRDADCVTERGLCQVPQPVNRQFQQNYRDYSRQWNARINCTSTQEPPPLTDPVCLKNRCALE